MEHFKVWIEIEKVDQYGDPVGPRVAEPQAYGVFESLASAQTAVNVLLSQGVTIEKTYYRRDNVGRAKYTINYHDGVKTHPDGSPFFELKIFSNKKKMVAFVKELEEAGYQEN